LLGEGEIEANQGRPTAQITVANTGDRPIQVGSHFHFFEANKALSFDRGQAFGMRLDIPAGTAVALRARGREGRSAGGTRGARAVYGLNALTDGPRPASAKPRASRARPRPDLRGARREPAHPPAAVTRISTADVGDRCGSPDTELLVEVERDFTTYGDEVKFGGGKVIRDGMGQSPEPPRARACSISSSPTR